MKDKIESLYLMYVNNFLTLKEFAEYIETDEVKANRIIDLGRQINHLKWTNRRLKQLS